MAEARLAAGIWVAAYLRRLALADIPAYVTRRGDDTAGAVMVKCATLDGRASLWTREWDLDTDQRLWIALNEAAERDIDAEIARNIAQAASGTREVSDISPSSASGRRKTGWSLTARP